MPPRKINSDIFLKKRLNFFQKSHFWHFGKIKWSKFKVDALCFFKKIQKIFFTKTYTHYPSPTPPEKINSRNVFKKDCHFLKKNCRNFEKKYSSETRQNCQKTGL